MICEHVFHLVKQIEETDTWKSSVEGEEETSIFGDGALMMSQGRESRCGLPSSDGITGETCKRGAAKHKTDKQDKIYIRNDTVII